MIGKKKTASSIHKERLKRKVCEKYAELREKYPEAYDSEIFVELSRRYGRCSNTIRSFVLEMKKS